MYQGVQLMKKLILCIFATLVFIFATRGFVWSKPIWIIPTQWEETIDKWTIGSDGTITYAFSGTLARPELTGMAVDSDTNTLFVAFERAPGFEILNGTTMISLGDVHTGVHEPGDFVGMAIDSTNNLLYTIQRSLKKIYVYHFDNESPLDLSLVDGYPKTLPYCVGAIGIALDDISGVLYVADMEGGNIVRVYDTATWLQISTFSPGVVPVGIAVDRVRRFVYTSSPDQNPPEGECLPCLPSLDLGSTLLCRYDVNSGGKITVDLGHGGMGIAVDENTGYVYVTGGCNGDNVSVWTSDLVAIQTTDRIGDPAGITIPQYPAPGIKKVVDKFYNISLRQSNVIWNSLADAASGDSIKCGIAPIMGYCNGLSSFDRIPADTVNGAWINVTKTPVSGGNEVYAIKKTITTTPETISFGFTSMMVILEASANNTADIVVDWLGNTVSIPGIDAAGDDLISPGDNITWDRYAVSFVGVSAVSGSQTIQIKAFR